MKKFGLIGETLNHCYSGNIYKHFGVFNYITQEVKRENLEEFIEEKKMQGFNVSRPFKQMVLGYCTNLSDEAKKAVAVNTVIYSEKGELCGYNTEYFGMAASLEKASIDVKGKKCMILGSGGGSGVAHAVLTDKGAKEIITVSRQGEVTYENLYDHRDSEIIINATPVGRYPNNLTAPINIDDFTKCEGVMDLVYNPLRTKLILDCERKSIPCIGGLYMLVAQCKGAAEIFLGEKIHDEKIEEVYNTVLEEMQNIILIGMPSAGKTMIGYEFAKKYNKNFIDIDGAIMDSCGISIPEIIETQGVPVFRKIETDILKKACKELNCVIATGGGVVKNNINYNILKQNGKIVWVKRNFESLTPTNSHLFEEKNLKDMYEERKYAYSAWCDEVYFNEERD